MQSSKCRPNRGVCGGAPDAQGWGASQWRATHSRGGCCVLAKAAHELTASLGGFLILHSLREICASAYSHASAGGRPLRTVSRPLPRQRPGRPVRVARSAITQLAIGLSAQGPLSQHDRASEFVDPLRRTHPIPAPRHLPGGASPRHGHRPTCARSHAPHSGEIRVADRRARERQNELDQAPQHGAGGARQRLARQRTPPGAA